MFVCLHHMHYVFDPLGVCVFLFYCRMRVHARTHKLHICPELVGSTDWFWALGLIALLQT